MAEKQVKTQDAPSGNEKGRIASFGEYLTESHAEMKKVTWPAKKEVKVTSIAVLVLVVVMAIFLGLVDLGLTKFVETLLTKGA